MKMPKFLTIQKPNVRQFSVNGFAVALKLNNFDDKNFMIWRAKMVLWFDCDELLLRCTGEA